MDALLRHSVRHPWRVLGLAALLVAAAAPGLGRLTLRTDGAALAPAGDPAVRVDREVRERFGVGDTLVVVVDAGEPGSAWSPETLGLLAELTDALAALPGLAPEAVSSLATEVGDRYRPGALSYMPLLEPRPETSADVERVRDEVRAVGLYDGTLVALDGSAATVLVDVPAGTDRAELYRRVAETAREARARHAGPARVEVLGAPAVEALLGERILVDLGLPAGGGTDSRGPGPALGVGLMPLALGLMAALFALAFRSIVLALLPLGKIGACLALTFGVVGFCGVPVTLPLTVLPVILVSVGVADEVHVLWRWRVRRAADPEAPRETVALDTMRDLRRPVVTTSVTTAVALASFLSSPIGPVRQFGLVAACGVLCAMLWSLLVTPALLVLLPHRVARRGHGERGVRGWERLGRAVASHPWRVLVPAAALLALVPLGARRVIVEDSWIDGFPPGDPLVRATESFERRFAGAHVLLLEIDGGRETLAGELSGARVDHHRVELPPGVGDPRRLTHAWLEIERPPEDGGPTPAAARLPGIVPFWRSWIESAERTEAAMVLTTPRHQGSPRFGMRLSDDERLHWRVDVRPLWAPGVLRELSGLERLVASHAAAGVGGVLGPPDFIAATEFLVARRRQGSRRLPDDPARVRWTLDQQRRIRGETRTARIVDPDGRRGLITVLLRDPHYRGVAPLLAAIDGWAEERLAPLGIRVRPAGDVARSQALIHAVVRTQLRSLALSLAGVLLVAGWLGRSFRAGVYAVLPCAASVAVLFAVMGTVGVPLGVATSMFAGIVLGIGVDHAVHLVTRVRRGLTAGLAPVHAIARALGQAGPAVAVDALVVGSGFALLALSTVPANARLGVLVALCLATSLAVTVGVLPALLRLAPPPPERPPAPASGPGV